MVEGEGGGSFARALSPHFGMHACPLICEEHTSQRYMSECSYRVYDVERSMLFSLLFCEKGVLIYVGNEPQPRHLLFYRTIGERPKNKRTTRRDVGEGEGTWSNIPYGQQLGHTLPSLYRVSTESPAVRTYS
jgi:hypothetical protein